MCKFVVVVAAVVVVIVFVVVGVAAAVDFACGKIALSSVAKYQHLHIREGIHQNLFRPP